MLASELLLFLFICQWIRAQYNESKSRLATDVQRLFTQVENEIRDSLLNRQVSAVVQQHPGKDTALILPEFPENTELKQDNNGRKKSIHLYSKTPGTATIIHQQDSATPNTIILNPTTAAADREKSDKILRMALQELINNLDVTTFKVTMDTVWLHKAFAQSIVQRFPGIQVIKTQANKTPDVFSYQVRDTRPGSPYLSLRGHYFYLFKEVLPQAIFCLVLSLISSLAFLLAYLNARRQNLFVRQKDDFISNISHELKTPVATAKIAIEALNKYDAIEDPERTRRYLAMADWELNRLETMISKIMDTTQADHGVLTLDQQKIHLQELIREITDSLKQVFIQEQIALQLNIEEQAIYVLGDRTHLTGVIYNLLDNAIKYGKERICLELYTDNHKVHLKIADKGPGIPPAYREKIFEKFVRIPQENIHNVKGYGLGLSYARYVTEAHKGNLKLQQEAGWGAVFHICLPEWRLKDEV